MCLVWDHKSNTLAMGTPEWKKSLSNKKSITTPSKKIFVNIIISYINPINLVMNPTLYSKNFRSKFSKKLSVLLQSHFAPTLQVCI